MIPEPARIGLMVVAVLFVLLTIWQGVLPALARRRGSAEARAKHGAALRSGLSKTRAASERAASFLEAARIAQSELGDPRRAAKHTRNAASLAPLDAAGLELMIGTHREVRAHVALEEALWSALAHADDASLEARAWDALEELYRGPLGDADRAKVIARLRARSRH